MRLGALLNDAQYCGRSPTSVGGGDCAEGNWLPNTRSCGPGSVTLAGFLALIAPCGGSSGLPKEAAAAAVADIATPAAAVARTSRLEIMAFSFHVNATDIVVTIGATLRIVVSSPGVLPRHESSIFNDSLRPRAAFRRRSSRRKSCNRE